MAWPTLPVNTTNLDAGTDSPAQARADLLDAVNKINSIITELGGGDTSFDSVQLTGGTGDQGTISWNVDEETIDVIQDGAVLQVGQELQVHCRNNTAGTIANGTVVMATGTLGASGRITVAPMVGSNPANAKYIIGVATEDILAGTDGKVTVFGKVRHYDTSLWAEGTVLYVSTTQAGDFQTTEPTGTDLNMPIAFTISQGTNGTIMVRVNAVDQNLHASKTHTHTESDITDLGAYITDAPSDGSQYARQDGAWSAVTGGGGSALPMIVGKIDWNLGTYETSSPYRVELLDVVGDTSTFVKSGLTITVPAGTYFIETYPTMFRADSGPLTRLYNETQSSTIMTATYLDQGTDGHEVLVGTFTFAETTTFDFRGSSSWAIVDAWVKITKII